MTTKRFPPTVNNNPELQGDLADLLVEQLEQIGVEYIFGVPGGAIEPLYNAMARSSRKGGLRPIVARHESGAAFMADGYARETGKLGVCCSTTGPGATNLITGVASAYTDHIPLLVITAQTRLPDFSMGAFQESSADVTDILGMFEHCTRYNTIVTHADQLEKKLAAAFVTALQPPKGPAHLSVPVDLLRSDKSGQIAFPNLHGLLTQPASEMDVAALEKLCQE
ncbi:MAG: thiamine pyrophosphate-binding protein, partial [Desulfuromonadales bacterium]|nr:thiamine pyrophosphate-binding protein [Desulfuromonadales bacterium]